MSEYVNLHYVFTLEGVKLYDLNKGYLVVEQVTEKGNLNIVAQSGDIKCTANIKYEFLDFPTAVYNKTDTHTFSETS